MKTSELKKLIKEEVHSALNEGKKYLNDMSYEELIALRKRMDFKKASREEKKYVKDLIDKKKPLDEVADKLVQKEIFGKYSTKKAPRDTTDEESPDYDLYMGNDDPEYRRFYMALKRLVEKSSKKLDKNYEILEWIESLLNHMRPDKKG